jgi:hypothetical protein
MFNILSHRENADQNDTEQLSQNGCQKTTNVGDNVCIVRGSPHNTLGRNVNWCSHYGNQYGGWGGGK